MSPFAWSALIAGGALAAVLIFQRRSRASRLTRLRAHWGDERVRDRDMAAISAYFRASASAADTVLDDRTWADLDMDDVYALIDRTESAIGQQVLYARLRSSPNGAHLDAFEALVTRASEDAPARERAQLALGTLGARPAYDLWRLTQHGALESARWQVLFPVAGLSMAGLLLLAPFWPPAILLMVAGALGSLVARASVARSLQVVAGAFRQVNPLVTAAEVLADFSDAATAPIAGTLRQDTVSLSRLRRIASWAGRDSSAAVAGDLPAIFFEYLNMVLWLDANALFFGSRELRARAPALTRVIAVVGEIDAALSIASYRAGTEGWTRPEFTSTGPVVFNDIRHPMLSDAVPNSLILLPPNGVVITGSNMSGKSTFLRTLGITAVMAQTINTCLARRYEAPTFVVRSCIGVADDLSTGRSYYLVEVESVLSLVHAARTPQAHLMLFDEMFRGTNAVERIAAAEAVLVELAQSGEDRPVPHVVIVATHDQELVDVLQGLYAAHHFTDSVDEHGLTFDYTLHAGPATTRNAIALLAQRGAPEGLVARALERARVLDQARESARLSERPS